MGQTMQGTVTDAATHKPLFPVTVVNTSTQQTTLTDNTGLYVIPANTGDVIAFSYIGYETVKKTKPLSVLLATVQVTMEAQNYQLQEFTLRPGRLTQYQRDSAERRSTYRMALERTKPSAIMSPASFLADQFSRKSKHLYKFQKDFPRMEQERFIDTRYTAAVVSAVTRLTGDSIGHFMYAYPIPYDFARAATDLELKMWIKNNYKAWIKSGVFDTLVKAASTDSLRKQD